MCDGGVARFTLDDVSHSFADNGSAILSALRSSGVHLSGIAERIDRDSKFIRKLLRLLPPGGLGFSQRWNIGSRIEVFQTLAVMTDFSSLFFEGCCRGEARRDTRFLSSRQGLFRQ